jgi:hypothetical protein
MLVGVAVCGPGFALLGAIICAMLEQSIWSLGDTLRNGARIGGAMGLLLGAIAGCVFGCISALAGVANKYHAGRPDRSETSRQHPR